MDKGIGEDLPLTYRSKYWLRYGYLGTLSACDQWPIDSTLHNKVYFLFIVEFVEWLPTIFPVNIWSTYLFELSTAGLINFGSFVQRNALGLWFNNLESSNRADQWYDKILVQSGFDKSLIWQWICSKGTPLITNWTKGTHPKINLKSLKTYPLALLSTAGKESVQHLMSQSWSCCHCCGYPQSIRLFLIKVTIPSPLVDQTHLKRYTVQFGIFGYSLNLTNV